MKKIFSLLLFSFILLGCTSFAANSELAGTSWNLVSFNSTGASGTLSFTDTMMNSKFCNNVNQGYIYDSGTLVASGFAMSTKMYCEGLPMTLENAFTIDTKMPVILIGNSLTIRTSANNIFVFTKQETTPVMCTMQYAPVCGSVAVQCIRAPCPPVQETFSNLCMLKANTHATFLYEGECKTPPIVGGDKDEHGCIGSAGYSRSQSKGECVRVWEYEATDLEKAYDFAFNYGITTMDSLKRFRANDSITRQEAVKMFVRLRNNLSGIGMEVTGDFEIIIEGMGETDNSLYIDEKLFDPTLRPYIYMSRTLGIMKGSQGKFMPHQSLTKGQAIAILMRIADGRQDETGTPRWSKYAEQAHKLGYIALINYNDMEHPITRGELILWMDSFYSKWRAR